jgi:hypothetical protein
LPFPDILGPNHPERVLGRVGDGTNVTESEAIREFLISATSLQVLRAVRTLHDALPATAWREFIMKGQITIAEDLKIVTTDTDPVRSIRQMGNVGADNTIIMPRVLYRDEKGEWQSTCIISHEGLPYPDTILSLYLYATVRPDIFRCVITREQWADRDGMVRNLGIGGEDEELVAVRQVQRPDTPWWKRVFAIATRLYANSPRSLREIGFMFAEGAIIGVPVAVVFFAITKIFEKIKESRR